MSKICLALDGLSATDAVHLVNQLGEHCYAVKVHDLYDRYGADIMRMLKAGGAKRVWIDAKLHDTKDTVARRVEALAANGADIITVHASGGIEMMQAALDAALAGPTEIWAISVLTSLSPEEVERIYGASTIKAVLDLACMAKEAGIGGMVCSAQEVGVLSKHADLDGMQFIVPGTRSAGIALGQQKRSATPAEAMADGATYLVAGSQVTKAGDPLLAFKAMAAEMGTPVE
jgi:orotidine-5'-phosphate decarboxylase